MNVNLSHQDLRDLYNALDALRQSHGPSEYRDRIMASYAPGTDGHKRTAALYHRLAMARE